MAFINVLFPLQRTGKNTGFDSYTEEEISDAVKFNLKNIILTNPGERIWDSDFGVGIKHMLFEQMTSNLLDKYASIILGQIESYAPYITVEDLQLYQASPEVVKIDLRYSVNRTDISDVLEIEINDSLI